MDWSGMLQSLVELFVEGWNFVTLSSYDCTTVRRAKTRWSQLKNLGIHEKALVSEKELSRGILKKCSYPKKSAESFFRLVTLLNKSTMEQNHL